MRSSRIYFIATIVTISVLIFNQLFIQYWLYQKREDANVINVGGRQRMLSQRLVALTFTYRENPKVETKENLNKSYSLWKNSHESLLEQFSLNNSNEIHGKLNVLTPIISNAAVFIENPLEINALNLEQFISNQNDFLVKMDAIVKDLENDSENKLLLVIIIEIIFFIISLLLIIYEIVFIFKKITGNLQSKNKELKDSNQLLEQYAFLAAHDLKNPALNAFNFAKILKEELGEKINDKENLYLDLLIKSTNRLNETTNDLLQFSSVNNEGVKIVSFSPKDELEIIINQLEEKINKVNANIIIGELPNAIRADKYLLGLVFQNIISNALKFISKDRETIIKIDYHSEKNKHHFIFKDNGIGIAKEDYGKIFGLFKRLHRQDEYEGTGIGLSICNTIIQKHNGEIILESEQGKGSIFTVVLPEI